MKHDTPSPRQMELLAFITAHIRKKGSAPTTAMMAKSLGISSRSGALRILSGLESHGLVKRGPSGLVLSDGKPDRLSLVPRTESTETFWFIEPAESQEAPQFLAQRRGDGFEYIGWTSDKNFAIRFRDKIAAARHASWLRMGQMRIAAHSVGVAA